MLENNVGDHSALMKPFRRHAVSFIGAGIGTSQVSGLVWRDSASNRVVPSARQVSCKRAQL